MQTNKEKKRQKVLIVALVIVVIVAVVFWYTNKSDKAKEFSANNQQAFNNGEMSTESILRNMKIDFSILDNSLFKSLKSHGILPVTVTETGRSNPFKSY